MIHIPTYFTIFASTFKALYIWSAKKIQHYPYADWPPQANIALFSSSTKYSFLSCRCTHKCIILPASERPVLSIGCPITRFLHVHYLSMRKPVWAILGKDSPIHCWSMENTIFSELAFPKNSLCNIHKLRFFINCYFFFYKIARIYSISRGVFYMKLSLFCGLQ